MNREIQARLITVLQQNTAGAAQGILHKIFAYCAQKTAGREEGGFRYRITECTSVDGLPRVMKGTAPDTLIINDNIPQNPALWQQAARYKNLVLPYEIIAELPEQMPCRLYSYSVHSDSAGLTARNIRTFETRTLFEIVGIGVIGRVRYSRCGEAEIGQILAAASAATACSFPFACILDGINASSPIAA